MTHQACNIKNKEKSKPNWRKIGKHGCCCMVVLDGLGPTAHLSRVHGQRGLGALHCLKYFTSPVIETFLHFIKVLVALLYFKKDILKNVKIIF